MPSNMTMLVVFENLVALSVVEKMPWEGLAAVMTHEQFAQLRMLQEDTAMAWSIVTYKISVLPTPIESVIDTVKLVLALAWLEASARAMLLMLA